MKKLSRDIFFILLGLVILSGDCLAQEKGQKSGIIQRIEIFSGFAEGELEDKGYYDLIPLIVDFDFNVKRLTRKIGFEPSILLQFQVEPFANFAYQPNRNLEVGSSFFLKTGILPDDFVFQPYVKAGIGGIYMTQHATEQATQFNFIESYAAGAHYFFNNNTAFSSEVRFRHLSNAGIRKPNHGINSYFILVGIARKF